MTRNDRPRSPAAWRRRPSLHLEELEPRQLLSSGALSPVMRTLSDRFVVNAYSDVLQRDAEPGGEAGWSQALDGGASRTQVALALLSSPEYRGKASGRRIPLAAATHRHGPERDERLGRVPERGQQHPDL
jgi:hypothetical protein